MSPKQRLSPPSPDQGAFWGVEVEGNGATDPDSFRLNAKIVEPKDGDAYYPPTDSVAPITVTPVETARAALDSGLRKKRNRRQANTGKHSAHHPETGSYADGLKLGAYLPGFGPVMERNWDEAKTYARGLDAKRQGEEAFNPMLDSSGAYAVQPLVEAVAAALDVERGLSHSDPREGMVVPTETSEPPEITQITSEQKLMIIHENAGFVPATHDEKNTAIGLIFSATENGDYWVHSYLMETHDHLVKHYMTSEALSHHEAKKKAAEGVVSRINTMGDYLQGAIDDGTALKWLQDKLDVTLNPKLTLEELAVDSFEPVDPNEDARAKDDQMMLWAMAAVVRYSDYESHSDLPFLPMTEREDRSVGKIQKDKNKQLYNPYVAAFMLTDERPEIMDKYTAIRHHIAEQIRTITVKELRTLVPRALEDQRNRYGFWKQALKDVKGSFRQAAQQRIDS